MRSASDRWYGVEGFSQEEGTRTFLTGVISVSPALLSA